MESDEVQRIMDAVNDESNLTPREKSAHAKSIKRDTAIMMLLLGTGIRVSELVGIDIKDIDFKEASIKVVRKGGDEDEEKKAEWIKTTKQQFMLDAQDILNNQITSAEAS